MVYLPTFTMNLSQNIGKYTVHGSFGIHTKNPFPFPTQKKTRFVQNSTSTWRRLNSLGAAGKAAMGALPRDPVKGF